MNTLLDDFVEKLSLAKNEGEAWDIFTSKILTFGFSNVVYSAVSIGNNSSNLYFTFTNHEDEELNTNQFKIEPIYFNLKYVGNIINHCHFKILSPPTFSQEDLQKTNKEKDMYGMIVKLNKTNSFHFTCFLYSTKLCEAEYKTKIFNHTKKIIKLTRIFHFWRSQCYKGIVKHNQYKTNLEEINSFEISILNWLSQGEQLQNFTYETSKSQTTINRAVKSLRLKLKARTNEQLLIRAQDLNII